MKKFKIDNEIIMQIFISIFFIGILTFVSILMLSNLGNTIYEECCSKENGTLMFYECQEPPLFSNGTPCSELKTGYYCNINGTEIKANELECMLNITNSESG